MRRLAPVLLAALAACGGNPTTTLTVDASPKKLAVGPDNYSTITVTGLLSDGTQLLDGNSINFSVDVPGSFSKDGPMQSEDVEITAHKAEVKLYSPSSPADIVVNVKYVDVYGAEVRTSITVSFVTATSVTSLSFSCDARNIGAFLGGFDALVPCRAEALDDDHKPVSGARIHFFAEAGEILEEEDSETGKLTYTYDAKSSAGQYLKPKNVPPNGDSSCNDDKGEPCWEDSHMQGTDRIRNPRDGLVTIIAYVEGDAGQGEPYIDANDDKKWNEGEWLKDTDGDDAWSEEQTKYIWKQIKILWTGAVRPETPNSSVIVSSASGSFDIARGASIELAFSILDDNLNIVAANAPDDHIEWTVEGPVGPAGDPTKLLEIEASGIDMNDKGDINNPTSRASYMVGSSYTVTVKNLLGPDDEPSDYKFYGVLTRNAGSGTNEYGGPGDEQTVFALGKAL